MFKGLTLEAVKRDGKGVKGREMISKYQVTKLERTGPMGSF